jgi:hypothetical protein
VHIRRIQKCVVEIKLKHKTSKHFSTNNMQKYTQGVLIQTVMVKSDRILNFSPAKYLIMFCHIETECSIFNKAKYKNCIYILFVVVWIIVLFYSILILIPYKIIWWIYQIFWPRIDFVYLYHIASWEFVCWIKAAFICKYAPQT